MIYERAKLPRTQLVATDVIKIGTLPSCHVQLSDRRVAKVHAIIEVRSPAVHTGVRMSSSPGPVKSGGLFRQMKAAPTFCAASAKPG